MLWITTKFVPVLFKSVKAKKDVSGPRFLKSGTGTGSAKKPGTIRIRSTGSNTVLLFPLGWRLHIHHPSARGAGRARQALLLRVHQAGLCLHQADPGEAGPGWCSLCLSGQEHCLQPLLKPVVSPVMGRGQMNGTGMCLLRQPCCVVYTWPCFAH